MTDRAVLVWIRRHNADFAGHLKKYLFTDAPIVGIEKMVASDEEGSTARKR